MNKSVYLGGPIGGLSWEEATGWRNAVTPLLAPLQCLNPLRPFGGIEQTICNPAFNEHVNNNQILPFKYFFQRDYADVDSSALLFFNFIGAKRKSIGSVCEIARGYAKTIPIVCVMDEGNINADVFLLQHFVGGFSTRVYTLQEGVNLVRQFFGLPIYDMAAD